jgi:hypothetical protein
MDQLNSKLEVRFGSPCVFCGEHIDDTNLDPCSVVVSTKQKLWQVWWCHAKCFKARIAKSTHVDLSPAHF